MHNYTKNKLIYINTHERHHHRHAHRVIIAHVTAIPIATTTAGGQL